MDFQAIQKALVTMGNAMLSVIERLDEQTIAITEQTEILKEIRDKLNNN